MTDGTRSFTPFMTDHALVSIVINNYNYGRFLRASIDSALSQTYLNTEVIVVDDGSTDHSREIIVSYADRVVPVMKGNGGQPSALNAGYERSHGSVIVFLDSDDALLPTAIKKTLDLFQDSDVAKVHWPLLEVDEFGVTTGEIMPHGDLPEGDLREGIVLNGPEAYVSAPTSGNAWARRFLERVFPLPEIDGYRLGGLDVYLSTLAPLFGRVRAIAEPQGKYRLHGRNNYSRLMFDEKYRQDRWCYDNRCAVLGKYCHEMGIDVDPESWKRNSWLYRFPQVKEELAVIIPPGETIILVDEQHLGSEVAAERRVIPFLERDGEYWGEPPDGETAIRELERLRQAGAAFIVFAWPAFWWFDYYSDLHDYMRAKFRCVLDNERVVAFDLRSGNDVTTSLNLVNSLNYGLTG